MRFLAFFLTLIMLSTAAIVAAQDDTDEAPPLPTLNDLSAEWLVIPLAGETGCARDTPYQFFARRGTSNNLMVYFQGGGACWNSLTCREGGTFDDAVDDDELLFYDGIFDFSNPDNPLANYSMVFVPYCTADIHIGDTTIDYTDSLSIRHSGYTNSAAVLDWAYSTFTSPNRLFITGSSAGAYGAIYHAPYILNQYPNASAAILGDAGIGVTPVGWSVLEDNWNIYANMPPFVPELAEADPTTFTTNLLYSATAQAFPNARIGQFTHYADSVQILFYQFSQLRTTDQDWIDGMAAALGALDALPNFTSYVAAGTDHTILALPEFYTLEVDGLTFREWLNALLNDNQPESVFCTVCEVDEPDTEDESDASEDALQDEEETEDAG